MAGQSTPPGHVPPSEIRLFIAGPYQGKPMGFSYALIIRPKIPPHSSQAASQAMIANAHLRRAKAGEKLMIFSKGKSTKWWVF